MTDAPKHPISPDPANELASDHSPIDPRDFRNALGTFATGVTIITAAGADGKPYGLTCNSFASVSLNPPLVAFLPGKESRTSPKIVRSGRFCVNVLGAHQEPVSRAFATGGERKFESLEWTPSPTGLPRLDSAVAWIECTVEAYAYNRQEPLLFARGGYGRFRPGGGGSASKP